MRALISVAFVERVSTRPVSSIVDDNATMRGKQLMQKDCLELFRSEMSKAESELALPVGEFGTLLLAGALLSLSVLYGPSTLFSATKGVMTTAAATFSTATTQMRITLDPRFKAEAAEYRAVLEPFGQTTPTRTYDYQSSRRAKCPGYFLNSVRAASRDHCRTAKRSTIRTLEIDAGGKDARVSVR